MRRAQILAGHKFDPYIVSLLKSSLPELVVYVHGIKLRQVTDLCSANLTVSFIESPLHPYAKFHHAKILGLFNHQKYKNNQILEKNILLSLKMEAIIFHV